MDVFNQLFHCFSLLFLGTFLDLQCDAGYFLPFGESTCHTCNPGEYSIGGGQIISDWTSFPEGMSADCTGTNCRSEPLFPPLPSDFNFNLPPSPAKIKDWQMNGTFATSGPNSATINTKMNLRLYANFIRPTGNKIRFSYTVDAESCLNCDGCDSFFLFNLYFGSNPSQPTNQTGLLH